MPRVQMFCVLAVVLGAAPASAQDAADSSAPFLSPAPVAVTPFVSLGSSSRVGGAVSFLVAPRMRVEAEVGYRGGPVGTVGMSASLLYDLPKLGRVTPYLAAGIGLDEYVAAATGVSGAGPVPVRQTALTINAGGGIQVPIDNNWGLRTDARWSNGLGREAPERWRLYNGLAFGAGRASR